MRIRNAWDQRNADCKILSAFGKPPEVIQYGFVGNTGKLSVKLAVRKLQIVKEVICKRKRFIKNRTAAISAGLNGCVELSFQ